jgi:hypothetical protein
MTDLRRECARDGDRKSPIQIWIAVVTEEVECEEVCCSELSSWCHAYKWRMFLTFFHFLLLKNVSNFLFS